MILIKLLNLDEFYGQDETIEIAKGKYKLAESVKDGIKQIKRIKNEKRSSWSRSKNGSVRSKY